MAPSRRNDASVRRELCVMNRICELVSPCREGIVMIRQQPKRESRATDQELSCGAPRKGSNMCLISLKIADLSPLDDDQYSVLYDRSVCTNSQHILFSSGGLVYVDTGPITDSNLARSLIDRHGLKRVRIVNIDGL